MKAETSEPQAAQIAAHEAYLVVRAAVREAESAGDEASARRLRVHAERAKRRWHRLVKAAVRGMRATRR